MSRHNATPPAGYAGGVDAVGLCERRQEQDTASRRHRSGSLASLDADTAGDLLRAACTAVADALEAGDLSACVPWPGRLKATGYGIAEHRATGTRPTTTPAHRAVWRLMVGPLTPGHDLDHVCRSRSCVRPDHLEEIPRLEHLDRQARDARLRRIVAATIAARQEVAA